MNGTLGQVLFMGFGCSVCRHFPMVACWPSIGVLLLDSRAPLASAHRHAACEPGDGPCAQERMIVLTAIRAQHLAPFVMLARDP